ncbi:hypothetical protein HPP92_017354 [Vanilla planifolia]|uniref:Uncharacterized protein n=1 Tax=Vanilla planifolia TaxID=51239 RepID=A0A835QJC4_VANPL|nr:hypothetical protein HPP92_017354 [Vanilla planifolia]
MSFLAGRLIAKEGSFFLQESKIAAARLAEKLPASTGEAAAGSAAVFSEESVYVLPEILRHSIPIKANTGSTPEPSLPTSSKWLLKGSSSSHTSAIPTDTLNPLRAHVSLPHVTFGPKRWTLTTEKLTFSASTANELRHDRYTSIDPEKLKALAKGYTQIGKAFAIATMVVFGGGMTLLIYTARRLQIESTDHIRSKGRDLILPQVDMIRERMAPIKSWVDQISKKPHMKREVVVEKSFIKELERRFVNSSK